MESVLLDRVVRDAMALRNKDICDTIRDHRYITRRGWEGLEYHYPPHAADYPAFAEICNFRIFILATRGDLSHYRKSGDDWLMWLIRREFRKPVRIYY